MTPDSMWYLYLVHGTFLWEMLVGEWVFARNLPCRRHSALRMAGSLAAQLLLLIPAVWLLARLPAGTALTYTVQIQLLYLTMLALSWGGLWFCFAAPPRALLLTVMLGYAFQHLISQLCLIFADTHYDWLRSGLAGMAYRCVTAAIYLLAAVLARTAAGRGRRFSAVGLQRGSVLFLSAATILLTLVLSSYRDFYHQESLALSTITRLFSAFCCLFLLLVHLGFLEKSRLEQDMETIDRLHYKELEQFRQRKETIDLINTRCHDLKRRLAWYQSRGDAVTREELAQLERAVSLYDRAAKTGNDTLDTILSERSLVCEKEGITLSCIADGASLAFLSPGDVYAIFGNAVDNAMEAVRRLPDPRDRVISLSVRRRMGMLSILVENPCAGPVTFVDGLPRTSKDDPAEHGYGMRSIQLTAARYGGEMTVTAGELFTLSVLLPLPDGADRTQE